MLLGRLGTTCGGERDTRGSRNRSWEGMLLGDRGTPRGQGEGPGPRRPSAAHLRVGHHQALVAFTVVPPFILVHLPLVHPPARPRAGGRGSAWAPAAAVGGGAPVSHGLRSTLWPRLPGSGRRKPRPRRLPWLNRATSGFALASPPLTTAADGQEAILGAGTVTHFRSADLRTGKEVSGRAPEVRQAGGAGGCSAPTTDLAGTRDPAGGESGRGLPSGPANWGTGVQAGWRLRWSGEGVVRWSVSVELLSRRRPARHLASLSPRFLFCEVGCESSRTGLLVTWRRTTPAVP